MKDPVNLKDPPVIIVGGGPTGLSLALGLARLKVNSILLEKKPKTSDKSKAPGIHVRTREVFNMWGIEKEILAAGNLIQKARFHAPKNNRVLLSVYFKEIEKEVSDPGLLILEQGETESILCKAVEESGYCDIRFSYEAIALKQLENNVTLTVKSKAGNFEELDAPYVIGCDGASSFVRNALKMPFDGFTYSVEAILADIKINDKRDELPMPRIYNGKGIILSIRLRRGLWRIIRLDTGSADKDKKVPKSEIAKWVKQILGDGDFELVWANSFRIHRRSSPRFRVGRVFLAGDAAHVHSPAGGQGMNAGIQDAHNLAWKLAAVLEGKSEELLDSYETERKEVVVKKISRFTNFVTRVFFQSPLFFRTGSFFMLRQVLKIKSLRVRVLRKITMIDQVYTRSGIQNPGDRMAGERLPNPELIVPNGTKIRLYELLKYRPVVIEIKNNNIVEENDQIQVIRIGDGAYHDPSGLLKKLVGKEEGWVLVRPDAHILWAGNDYKELNERKNLFLKRSDEPAILNR